MEIIKNGIQPSVKGPEDWFTGAVRIDPLFGEERSNKRSRCTSDL